VEELVDLATIDILRDRERGVPRYNRFRELFHKPRIRSFEQMTEDPELARELRDIYGHPDKVDLMVGMYAETPPEGFGFSDTAFRVFILMASRRLKSDRFITQDYTAAVYTQPGIDWIENNNMTTVLLRHFPELTPVLQRTQNASRHGSLWSETKAVSQCDVVRAADVCARSHGIHDSLRSCADFDRFLDQARSQMS